MEAVDFDRIEREEGPFAKRLAAWIVRELGPDSVLDLGCGPGTYVDAIRSEGGVATGYDCDERVAGRESDFLHAADILTDTFTPAPAVLCLEVAEHVIPEMAEAFVRNVAAAVAPGGTLIWSAAQPGQGGEGHVNCQPKGYWAGALAAAGLQQDTAAEGKLLAYAREGAHMGWFVNNLLVFRRPLSVAGDRTPVHVLSIAHVPVRAESTRCAYTMKVYNLCRMLKGMGYPVTLYGLDGSDETICDEFVPVVSKAKWKSVYGTHDQTTFQYDWSTSDKVWKMFQRQAAFQIPRHFRSCDPAKPEIVCCSFGWAHQPCTLKLPDNAIVVESGIGYRDSFAPFRVFESRALMHMALARKEPDGVATGMAYWSVIPNYYDPSHFTYSEEKGDYFLFIGRLNSDKGYNIALDACRRIGARIIIVGQIPVCHKGKEAEFIKGITDAGGEYLPSVGPEERAELYAKAKGVFVPSQYVEPFGGVHIEAGLSGTPVITTDWGVFGETVVQGATGFRCKTMAEFVWAAQNIGMIKPEACRSWALGNFSMKVVAPMYDRYFWKLAELSRGNGWDCTSLHMLNGGEILSSPIARSLFSNTTVPDDDVPKVSACVRAKNEVHTIKACLLSILDVVDEVVLVDNGSTDGTVDVARSLNSEKIKIVDYPHAVCKDLATSGGIDPTDPSSPVAFENFAMDQCSHDWILIFAADIVLTQEGAAAVRRSVGRHPFCAFGGWEVTSPVERSRDFSGEEPLLYLRTLDDGLRFQKYTQTGLSILWSPKWGKPVLDWGPRYYSNGKGPFWWHYGRLTACDPNRATADIPQVPIVGAHHPAIVPNLAKIFPPRRVECSKVLRVKFVGHGLAKSTNDCVAAMIRRCGHVPVDSCHDVQIVHHGAPDITGFLNDDVPTIRWWLGSDVLQLDGVDDPVHHRGADFNWAGSPGLRDELLTHGIAANVVPVLPVWEPKRTPLPKDKSVLVYSPEQSSGLYRWEDTLRVIEAFPDVEFRVLLREEASTPSNVTFLGRVQHDMMPDLYASSVAMLRLVEHDGMSLSVLEALGFGLHVVWSHVPDTSNYLRSCRKAATLSDAQKLLGEALGSSGTNDVGIEDMLAMRHEVDGDVAVYLDSVFEMACG